MMKNEPIIVRRYEPMEVDNTVEVLRDIFAPWLRLALQDAALLTPDDPKGIIPDKVVSGGGEEGGG